MTLHFMGKPYENCRSMSCYGATLGSFCPTHAAISDERVNEDLARDGERERWNAALASGDAELIEQAGRSLLNQINTRIMDDETSDYDQAGWTRT